MALPINSLTLVEFLALPDEKPALEFAPNGTVIQKPSPGGQHSLLQFEVCSRINAWGEPRRLAVAFLELQSVFAGAAFVPDVSVYRWGRIPRLPEGQLADDFLAAPDIAIEIVSPEQSTNALIRRSLWYVQHGVEIALLVDPSDSSVIRWHAQDPTAILTGADEISFGEVLPGLTVTVSQLFGALHLD